MKKEKNGGRVAELNKKTASNIFETHNRETWVIPNVTKEGEKKKKLDL